MSTVLLRTSTVLLRTSTVLLRMSTVLLRMSTSELGECAQRVNLAIEFGVDISSGSGFVLVAQLDRAQDSEA
jgi:hypothetical protein